MHIHRIQIHIKQVHIKQSLAKHRKGKECKSIEIEMMNGWGFALSPPYSLFLFSLVLVLRNLLLRLYRLSLSTHNHPFVYRICMNVFQTIL